MKRFSIAQNGYDIDEVNRFIDIVIGRLDKLNKENETYLVKIEELENKIQDNVDAKKLEKALLTIQDTSDRIKQTAEEEARMIVDEAKNNANAIIHEALVNAEKTEQERMILESNMKIYKERVKNLIETQLRIAEDLDKIEL